MTNMAHSQPDFNLRDPRHLRDNFLSFIGKEKGNPSIEQFELINCLIAELIN